MLRVVLAKIGGGLDFLLCAAGVVLAVAFWVLGELLFRVGRMAVTEWKRTGIWPRVKDCAIGLVAVAWFIWAAWMYEDDGDF